jgi:translation initiation factor IF-3
MSEKPNQPQIKRVEKNEAIRAFELIVIDEEKKPLGKIKKFEALQIARDRGLDLVIVDQTSRPPTAKIMDYGKKLYDDKKRAQENRKPKETVKQIQIGYKIGENDLNIKIEETKRHLSNGHKVIIKLQLRGREIAHSELGLQTVNEVIARIESAQKIKIEQKPNLTGRDIIALIAPQP